MIENCGRIDCGTQFRIRGQAHPVELYTGPQGLIEFADDVFLNQGVSITASKHVKLGRGVNVCRVCRYRGYRLSCGLTR